MILVLIKYIHSRHRFASIQGSSSLDTPSTIIQSSQLAAANIKVDKMLLLRFGIAFVILSAFEVSLILFEFMRRSSARTLADQNQPDLSPAGAVNDILDFMPGVTASLLAFLLFGTTAQFRKRYVEAVRSARFWRRRSSSLVRTNGGMEVWDTLGSGGPVGTYRCSVRAGGVGSIELQGHVVPSKSRSSVVFQAEEERLPARSMSARRQSYMLRPWRSLSI